MKSKKGFLDSLASLAIGAGIATITIVVILLVMANLAANTTVAADANASAAVDTAQNEVGGLPDWLGLLIIVAIAVVILAVIKKIRG